MYGESFAKGDRFTKLAEGVMTSKALYKLGQEYGVDLPIVESVYKVFIRRNRYQRGTRNSVYAFCQERILIGQVHNMGNTKAKNNSNKPKQTGKTVTSVKKQNTVEYVIVNILCLFVFIAFAYIAIMSFVQTSVFDSANYGSEIILYQTDNIALNILFTSLFTVFIFK